MRAPTVAGEICRLRAIFWLVARPSALSAAMMRRSSSSSSYSGAALIGVTRGGGRASSCSVHLEQARRAHTAGHAHRHDHPAHAAPLALDERVTDQACPAHAVRMTDRNGAAVYVEALVVDAEPVAAIQRLHRKGLVEFPQADISDGKPVPRQQLRH